MDIILKSKTLEITNIIRKTKAEMFKNLAIGNKIVISVKVESAGSNRGTYASYMTVENIENGECAYKSFNQINQILNCFEFKGDKE